MMSVTKQVIHLPTKLIKTRSNKLLSFVRKQLQACFHFYQTCSLQWPPSCLQVRIKPPTWLSYTMTCSISRRSNSTFKDDVSVKASDSITHMESNFCCEGWGNIIVSSEIMNIFSKVKNRIQHKVKLHAWENSILCYCFSENAHDINLFHIKDDYDVLCHLILMLWICSGVVPLLSPRLPFVCIVLNWSWLFFRQQDRGNFKTSIGTSFIHEFPF